MIPVQRGTIPAQRGTIGARATAVAPPAGDAVTAHPVADTAIPAPLRDTGVAAPTPGTAAAPPGPDMAGALSAPDTIAAPPADRQAEVAASGPKAAKATVQKKLAHARVLLSQRTAQTAAAPSIATAATAATAAPSPAVPATATASTAAPSTITGSTVVPSSIAPSSTTAFVTAPPTTSAATTAPPRTAPSTAPAPAAATPPAATPSGTYATKARKAIAFARAQVGKPCVWGAAGPGSYDCAGLTQAAWKSAGVTLPRTAREQADAGTAVAPADARPGDLVFFHDDAGHVGLCTGDGTMIHAPRPGAYVREEPFSGVAASVHSVVRPG
ncbi:NlpC/P60 family protein [Streptomyces sp. NPDC052727]|uniref:C40 family peptidase n=1 Tax=Streptomyces sp. NPDC052727 TaxID=3154854 RepID=UPI003425379E